MQKQQLRVWSPRNSFIFTLLFIFHRKQLYCDFLHELPSLHGECCFRAAMFLNYWIYLDTNRFGISIWKNTRIPHERLYSSSTASLFKRSCKMLPSFCSEFSRIDPSPIQLRPFVSRAISKVGAGNSQLSNKNRVSHDVRYRLVYDIDVRSLGSIPRSVKSGTISPPLRCFFKAVLSRR